MAKEEESYELHKSVFIDDRKTALKLLRDGADISQKDKHGNTPLHLAIMLGHRECTELLISHNAPIKVKNNAGWSPLAEATSYGDRKIIKLLFEKFKSQAKEQMNNRRPDMMKALENMGDFYMELKWDFQSWVPLVSRLLPSDICKIYKRGCSMRLDTTLVDFNDMKWERGDISFIFRGCDKPPSSLVVLDNKLKVYQRVEHEQNETETEDEIDMLMCSDIVASQVLVNQITFTRAQVGWIFKEDKEEMIGKYKAEFYALNGFTIVSKKRREHLSQDDLQKNRAIMEALMRGSGDSEADIDKPPIRRESLSPPMKPNVTWTNYISTEPGRPPNLARPIVCKESSKSFKATVAMSEQFPLTTEKLLSVLEVVAPFKHFAKLRDFVEMKSPPGFPVKIDIPLIPTVSAKITFQEFEYRTGLDTSYFDIPSDYVESINRFPDL